MNLNKQILTQNPVYTANRWMAPCGVMMHSTACNNPNLRRYVAPNDGLLGAPLSTHWNRSCVTKCVHAFIGRLADGSVATYQTLPWTMRGGHAGKGVKGSANDGYISFEICEDDLTDHAYFAAVYREAVELTAYLCQQFGLDPLADGVVICHAEGYQRGIASNHGDVLHWFRRYGKSMANFRADVAQELTPETKDEGDDDEMTEEQFEILMENYRKKQSAKPASTWAEESRARAMAAGITDGTRPCDFVTREEAAAMAVRAMTVAMQSVEQTAVAAETAVSGLPDESDTTSN